VRTVKAVKQNIQPTPELGMLFETYRGMVNHCIQVGLQKNITSRFRLTEEVYRELHNGLHTWYILSAVEKACAILKNYRKAKRKGLAVKEPYVSRDFISIGNQAYKITGDKLRLPTEPKRYLYTPLNRYTLKALSEPTLKLGSVTLTVRTVSISFSKETAEIEPRGYVGVDSNLDNITTYDTSGNVEAFDLSKATRIKQTYREVKSRFKRNDVRVRRRLFHKYGLKQKNRISQILHHISKEIVQQAKQADQGIVMEKLTGIRKLYRKGNGQGRFYRGIMNSWSFRELQRQIEYKAKWEGLLVTYVHARNTSKKCSICGLKTIPEENRTLRCPLHGVVDRDVNAARNILARGLRFKPVGQPVEGMVTEPKMVIRQLDGCQSNSTLTPTLD